MYVQIKETIEQSDNLQQFIFGLQGKMVERTRKLTEQKYLLKLRFKEDLNGTMQLKFNQNYSKECKVAQGYLIQ